MDRLAQATRFAKSGKARRSRSSAHTCLLQAKDLIADGIIREGFLWNSTDADYAMVAVGRLALDGTEMKDGMEIPGLGKASVDVPGKLIKVDKIMRINNETIDGLIAGGL